MAIEKPFLQQSTPPLPEPSADYVTRSEMETQLAAQREWFDRRIQNLEAELGTPPQQRPSPISVAGARVRGSRRLTVAAIAVLIGAWFIFFISWPALRIGFDGDDVMNLYRAWQPQLGEFVIANLFPFTSFYRPLGALYYRFSFDIFGWNPQAFRAVTCGLMMTNLLLIYLVAKRLSKSTEAAVLAVLLFTFPGRIKQIYLSNGTVYDVLCLTFTLLTLWYYVRMRESRRGPGLRNYEIAMWLFIAAINAKEMAAFLPAILLLYEWLWHPPPSWRPGALIDWLRKRGTFSFAILGLALLAFWARSRPGSAMYGVDLYKPSFTLHTFFVNEQQFLRDLFLLKEGAVNTTGVVIFYVGIFAGAWLSRRRHMWLLACFVLLGPLPVIFIPYRGLHELYVPLAGLAMYVACALVPFRDWLLRSLFRQQLPTSPWAASRVTVFVAIAILAIVVRNRDPRSTMDVTDPQFRYITAYHDSLLRLNEPMPEHAKVLLLKCQFPDDDWGPLVMTRELYRDTELGLDRPAMLKTPPDPATYDRVIDFDGTNLVVTSRKPAQSVNGAVPVMHRPSD